MHGSYGPPYRSLSHVCIVCARHVCIVCVRHVCIVCARACMFLTQIFYTCESSRIKTMLP